MFLVLAFFFCVVHDLPNPADLVLDSDVRYHETAAWYNGLGAERWAELPRSRIHTRREAPDGSVLLVTRAIAEEEYQRSTGEWKADSWNRVASVYRYDTATDQLQEVPAASWAQASGLIEACQFGLVPADLRTDDREGSLRFEGRPVDFAGWYLISISASPSGRKAAVLSLAGLRGPNLSVVVPAPDPIWGQRYHQVYSLEDGRFLSEPIRIPSRRGEFHEGQTFVCWAADESYVIYEDFFVGMTIVPVKSGQ